jgi:hypothetical protein
MTDKITIAVTVPAEEANGVRSIVRAAMAMSDLDPDLVCCVEGEGEVVRLITIRDAARSHVESMGPCERLDEYEHEDEDSYCDDSACTYCILAAAVSS